MLLPPLQSRSWKETKFLVGWEEQKTGAGMVQGTPLSALRGPPSRDEQNPGYPTPHPSVGLGGASSCPRREDRRPPGQATWGGATGPLGSRKESEASCPAFRFRRLHSPSRWPPRSPVALGSGRRAPQTWSPEHCVPDGQRPMAEGRREGPRQQATHGGAEGPLRLRDWLVAQIESGRYAGLRWEDAGETLFRIPWKHAAKQGYQAQQDAALFRAWAIYKGKHLEGVDKEDPSTWKTWLRCALNKSADFCEVRSLNQLDISNPYKVYRLLSDGAHNPVTRACAPCKEEGILHSQQVPPGEVTEPACKTEEQVGSRLVTEDKDKKQPPRLASLPPGPLAGHRYQAQDPAHPWGPLPSEDFSNPDFWLHVRLFYGAELVREATARAAESCSLRPRAAAAAAELLLGSPPRVAQVRFPEPPPGARVLRRLLPHLERGVLLWVAPEGVFAKRLCQGRVYWRGPLAPHRARPNKLERERTCQLLDTRSFLAELRAHLHHGRQEPEYQIRLCFGEEYPGPPDQPEERLIMAHVEPVFARELLLHSKLHGQVPRWRVPSPASPTASLTC
ncbi:LOW QUALITY PROTEIN: interferon regulatory factor 4-like [Delphinapterus leucas]|uniref:LOW QUALITY PROTEIN: interferon regulatory factor 4-like n=1 Tax=Delphinapterus leucas TaxID=9749 RepID=A0A2Y9PNG7_DELLE|nr:LOW QUALITY PROTEIN: interferon regulatory factor 4-like [Delphinapterus leucas]